MPYIDVDIDVDDFLSYCSRRDIDDLIDALIEDEYLPKDVTRKKTTRPNEESKMGKMESSFTEKLEQLSNKYYTLSSEDEETLETIFKKYL